MHMKLLCLNIACVAVLTVASCSKRPAVEGESSSEKETIAKEADRDAKGGSQRGHSEEKESLPEDQDIGEDCVAFLRSTVAKRSDTTPGQCPVCPSSAPQTEVLQFVSFKIERLSGKDSSCEAIVRIRATFKPSNGGTITGGLVGWISPEEREQYARGKSPSGEQVYAVKMIYHRTDDEGWRPVEFERVSP